MGIVLRHFLEIDRVLAAATAQTLVAIGPTSLNGHRPAIWEISSTCLAPVALRQETVQPRFLGHAQILTGQALVTDQASIVLALVIDRTSTDRVQVTGPISVIDPEQEIGRISVIVRTLAIET